jgi:hypothetical protein
MTENQYNNFKRIAKKICNNDDRCNDLTHDVIMNLSTNDKYNQLDLKSKTYFFVRAIKNQYNSNNSKFQREQRRYEFNELNTINEPIHDDEPYKERPSIEWVKETLQNKLDSDPDYWYEHGIFTLYLKLGKIESLHRQTKIPKYSLRDTLKEIKEMLNKKWIQYEKQNYQFTGETKM